MDLTFPGSVQAVTARSVNVSETGMLVRSRVEHPPGTGVRFDVPPRYGGRGEVAWTGEAEDGTVLLGLSLGRSRQALMELMEDHRI